MNGVMEGVYKQASIKIGKRSSKYEKALNRNHAKDNNEMYEIRDTYHKTMSLSDVSGRNCFVSLNFRRVHRF